MKLFQLFEKSNSEVKTRDTATAFAIKSARAKYKGEVDDDLGAVAMMSRDNDLAHDSDIVGNTRANAEQEDDLSKIISRLNRLERSKMTEETEEQRKIEPNTTAYLSLEKSLSAGGINPIIRGVLHKEPNTRYLLDVAEAYELIDVISALEAKNPDVKNIEVLNVDGSIADKGALSTAEVAEYVLDEIPDPDGWEVGSEDQFTEVDSKRLTRGLQGWDKDYSQSSHMNEAGNDEWLTDSLLIDKLGQAWVSDFEPVGDDEQMIQDANEWLRDHAVDMQFDDVKETPDELVWHVANRSMNEAQGSGPTDAQHNTIDRLIAQGGELYNKTQLVKGDEVAYFGINGQRKFAMYPDGTFGTGREFIDFQRDGWEIEMIQVQQ